MKTNYRKLALLISFMALGIVLSPFTSIPVGIARINPTQHFINVVLAVLIGTLWNTGAAAGMATIRMALGVGTILAYPGGMIGAFISGGAYKLTKNIYIAALGELLGTGLLAPLVSSLLIAPFLMGKKLAVMALMPSFFLSSLTGAVLSVVVLTALKHAHVLPEESVSQA